MADPFVWSQLSWVEFLVPVTVVMTGGLSALITVTLFRWRHWLEHQAAPKTPSLFLPPWLVIGVFHFLILGALAVGVFLGSKEFYLDSEYGGEAGNNPLTWAVHNFPFAIQYNGGTDSIYFNLTNAKYFTAGLATYLAAIVLGTLWFFTFYATGAVRTSLLLITLATLCLGNSVWTFWLLDLASGIVLIFPPAWFLYLWAMNVAVWANLEDDVNKPKPVNWEDTAGFQTGYTPLPTSAVPPALPARPAGAAAPEGYRLAIGIPVA